MTFENRTKRYTFYKERGNVKALAYMEQRWPDEFPLKEVETKSKGKK